MTKHFYAIDHANDRQPLIAFTLKAARDGFVADGPYRHAKTSAEADEICGKSYECSALDAVKMGFI